jgi:hypothetical protein
MIDGIRDSSPDEGIIDPFTFEKGVEDLYQTTMPDGVFCYTFFKAVARKACYCQIQESSRY